MPSLRVSLSLLVAALLLACGSKPRADSGSATTTTREPDTIADAGPVPLGRRADPGDDAGAGPPELPPKVVPNSVLEPQRASGSLAIEPDAPERAVIAKSGKSVVTVVKLCVKSSGAVAKIRLLKSSSYPAYDQKILNAMKDWTYRPIAVDGQPVDVCTAVTFEYPPAPSAPARTPPPAPTPPP